MLNFIFHKITSLFRSKKTYTIFIIYARKLSILFILIFILAIGAIGIGLTCHQSRYVFKAEAPIVQGNSANKSISISINVDWGQEYIPELLEILCQHHVRATFFITGRWAQVNGQLVQQIVYRGQDIGNHGFSHPHVNDLTLDENMDEIRQTEEVLYKLTKQHTKFYAPPYGEYNETVLDAAARSNLRTVLWSIDTVDWQNPTPQWIIARVQRMSHNGAIILMHPTPATVKALPDILTTLAGQGYEIVSLEKLLSE